MSGIFKAYDIRGVYPGEIDEQMAAKIAKAFVQFTKPKRIVIGRDMRSHSPPLFEAAVKAVTDLGVDVIDVGMVTTPMFYFSVIHLKADAGFSITASHNPPQFNGFKLVRQEAIPISSDTGIYEIEKIVASGKFLPSAKTKGKVTRKDISQEYIDNEFSLVDKSDVKKLKVVVDNGNGMSGIILPAIFERLDCKMIPLFFGLDGTFPNHEANPLKEETLDALKKKVRKEKADMGIAFDGDGDRIGFVDDKGELVSADLITALAAVYMLKKKPKSRIMYDLRCSKVVPETIVQNGGSPIECRVGHSFIKPKMRAENIEFCGELSGHYYLQQNMYIESPIAVMLMILQTVSASGQKFSEVARPLRKYFRSKEINFEVNDKEKAMKNIEAEFSKENPKRVYRLDGLSMEFADFWINVRSSNTESLLRLNAEAHTQKRLDEVTKKVSSIVLGGKDVRRA